MKKYFKRTDTVVDGMRQRALTYWKDSAMDTRNKENFVTNSYLNSFLDEMVKQGLLKFEKNLEGKFEYYIEEGTINGSTGNQKGNCCGNPNSNREKETK